MGSISLALTRSGLLMVVRAVISPATSTTRAGQTLKRSSLENGYGYGQGGPSKPGKKSPMTTARNILTSISNRSAASAQSARSESRLITFQPFDQVICFCASHSRLTLPSKDALVEVPLLVLPEGTTTT